jgi:hypothetical protein
MVDWKIEKCEALGRERITAMSSATLNTNYLKYKYYELG